LVLLRSGWVFNRVLLHYRERKLSVSLCVFVRRFNGVNTCGEHTNAAGDGDEYHGEQLSTENNAAEVTEVNDATGNNLLRR
jgi:hypothetical protein